MNSKPSLVYTVAIDKPGETGCRLMAKMLAASLYRTQFNGDIVIFHNSSTPIFFVEKQGVKEIPIDPFVTDDSSALAQEAWTWKYRVRHFIEAERYSRILFLDADCLVLRNLDHLLQGDWDIAFQRERGLPVQSPQFSCFLSDSQYQTLNCDGVNSGTLAVRGSMFQDVMAEWERIDTSEPPRPRHCSDQASWNRLLADADERRRKGREKGWKTMSFEAHEIQFPMYLNPHFNHHRHAAILHCLGGSNLEKLRFMFGTYMGNFFHDLGGTILNITDM